MTTFREFAGFGSLFCVKPVNQMTRCVLIIALVLLWTVNLHAAEPQYSRTRELPALKISLADMQSVLEKASHLLSDANREDGKKPKDIYLTETLPLLPMSPPRLSALLEPP
jgi:hypothetical protein